MAVLILKQDKHLLHTHKCTYLKQAVPKHAVLTLNIVETDAGVPTPIVSPMDTS